MIQSAAPDLTALTNIRDQNEDFIRYPIYIGLEPPCAYEWCLTTVPQIQLDGQIRHMPMGKGVGGGSLINGMLWNRGGQIDFENWKSLGNPGWGWADMLPYFKKVDFGTHMGSVTLTDKSPVRDFHSAVVRRRDCQFVCFDGFFRSAYARLIWPYAGVVPRLPLALVICLVRGIGRVGHPQVRGSERWFECWRVLLTSQYPPYPADTIRRKDNLLRSSL